MGRNAFLPRIEYFDSIKRENVMVVRWIVCCFGSNRDKSPKSTYLTAEKTSQIQTMLSTINAKNLSPP